jgi:hypothetical protein
LNEVVTLLKRVGLKFAPKASENGVDVYIPEPGLMWMGWKAYVELHNGTELRLRGRIKGTGKKHTFDITGDDKAKFCADVEQAFIISGLL